jgi:TRAP-type C4-dicarboxylate transport system substrate-binding protein
MNMKRIVSLTLGLFLVLGFMITHAQSQPIVLKAVTAFPRNHLNNDPVPIFIDKVNKRAEGKLKIDWVGGPEVIKSFDQVLALKAGTIDMDLYYPFGYMKPVMPEAWCEGLSQLAAWEERKSGAFELWNEIFKKRVHAKYIGKFHSLIPFTVFTNKKIEKIEDFKGMKIRVMPLYIPFIKALGAAPVTTPPTEIYTSMERGVVDGFMWPDVGMTSFGLQEVTKYSIVPGVFQMEPATMINLDKWNKIPKDVQNIIMDVMKDMEYIASMRNFMIRDKEHRDREEAGMKTIQLPPDVAAKFVEIAYDKTWEFVTQGAPEYAPRLRKVLSKAAVPKGTFPWQ